MKLAEALLMRTEYQNKLAELTRALDQNIKVQEGDKPALDPAALIAESLRLQDALAELIKQINRTNQTTVLDNGVNLANALVQRDTAAKKRSFLTGIIEKAGTRDYRLTRAEIKMLVTVSIPELQQQADRLAKEFREIDTAIQAKNWTTDIE
ncbi:MAG: DIP1984 family protein [Oscillospiraceae bacterium]|nr:DIP1984 family protein [Oscillospiraceae bacterium]